MSDGLSRALAKMRSAGVSEAATAVFEHYYDQLASGATGLIREDSIDSLIAPTTLGEVSVSDEQARDALSKTVLMKLNGGLGTSMGMSKAKSLLPVREGKSFLDLVVDQVMAARREYGARMPLLLMNSFNTSDDTMAALAQYPELPVDGLPLEFLQSQEPKLLADSLEPATWPADPRLEWCPPGHGDLYPSLLASGLLDQLIDAGFQYLSVSNSDNLGADPDARIAGWFAASGAPFAAEVCVRTSMDRKGGHFAVRKADGQLILRESAQTTAEDMEFFTDETRHRYFNTNNLWMDLIQLRDILIERDGVLGLPLIRNEKTVDPKDRTSPKVVQIESAMGAAVEVFPGAQAIEVPRSRFLPVKTTNELLLLRSDVYDVDAQGRLQLRVDDAPVIALDSAYYGKINDFEQRIPQAPSLLAATCLTVHGDWRFEPGTSVHGAVTLPDQGSPSVAAGELS